MKKLSFALIVVVLAVAVSAVVYVSTRPAAGAAALAEFSVDNLSCGACVSNIQNALAQVDGVGAVDVNVTMGQARVEFAPEEIGAETIAARISSADYPAKVKRVLSAEDYRALRQEQSRMSDRYVGRIGDELISREDFAAALGSGKTEGNVAATWNRLVQQQLLLQDAARNGIVVQDGEVQAEIDAMRSKHEGFDAFIAERYGSIEAFAESTRRNMIINRNIEQNVLAGMTEPREKRQVLDRWYRELSENTPVVVFDSQLKAALGSGQGGCGGCC